jgi:NAD(P)H-hydrate epimerase
VFLLDGEPRSADALSALERLRSAGTEPQAFTVQGLTGDGVIVDAMLGTGISGALRPHYATAVDAVNALQLPVFALDVPSGIDSDTGAFGDAAVRADWTLSFITAKRGLYTAAGAEFAGERYCDDLGVPLEAYSAAGEGVEVLRLQQEFGALPPRPVSAHKGHYGRCLLVGGDHGMGGAIVLAAEAALRCGVGLVKVATRAPHLAPLLTRLPEAMVTAVDHRNALLPLLAWADAVVIGPGLGQEAWGEQMLHACLASGKPLLVDADALNLLAAHHPCALPEGSVITPHPGEAARLLDMESAEVQFDRFTAAAHLAKKTGAAVVLKGNGSLVVGAAGCAVCVDGNPGMASGGTGDVLSGIVGALLAQGLAAEQAARLGTVLHAQAGDRAAQTVGERALLASEVISGLAELLK